MPYMSVRLPSGEIVLQTESAEVWGALVSSLRRNVPDGLCAPITDIRAEWLRSHPGQEVCFNHTTGAVTAYVVRAGGDLTQGPVGACDPSYGHEALVMTCVEDVLVRDLKRRPGKG